MGDQFDFSLLIGSQYDGGPMEWDEQTLYVSTGTILNHVDINKVSATAQFTTKLADRRGRQGNLENPARKGFGRFGRISDPFDFRQEVRYENGVEPVASIWGGC